MLHTKFCENWITGSGEDFEGFLPYTGVVAILYLVINSAFIGTPGRAS